jgi:hypothetical protein
MDCLLDGALGLKNGLKIFHLDPTECYTKRAAMENMMTIVPYILVGLIGLVVGAVIGALADSLINQRENSAAPSRRNLIEVMRIWKDRQNESLQLEIGGQMLPNPDNLSAKRYSELTRSIEELHQWMGLPGIAKRIQATPPPTPETSPAISATPEGAGPTPIPVSTPPGIEPPYEIIQETNIENKPPGVLNSLNIFERALRSKPSVEVPPLLSIAAQIDQILQEKLPSTPLSKHVIKLVELPDKGLVVLVNQQQYQGVNEVPDSDIRAFLQECVAEWERRVSS